ncbi:hypothetical protein ACFP1I_20375 [Dyadobacter subterraneus]|uniref:Uncharacterized protein n=1 Tax=Dyadobacter subterraneus TaxID=2773304 RepID=A0ABR9W6U4_9BACT|nr:hypothetical protein [Dyadobacter subterraneus]MBE9461187.1 hypothetical protein [Dyadobacter subterraneus]
MKKLIFFGSLIMTVFLVACKGGNDTLPIKFFESTFQQNAEDWTGDVALFKNGQQDTIAFNIKQGKIPGATDSTSRGLGVSGKNIGDSLFLFIKKKITGLDPALTYKVAYEINIGTNYPDTVGSAGRRIFIKAGASPNEPVKELAGNYYKTNLGLGALSKSGSEMMYLGTAGNGLDSVAYRSIVRTNANLAVEVKPNADGEIWLCVGAETSYKGLIQLYYDRIYTAVGEKPIE